MGCQKNCFPEVKIHFLVSMFLQDCIARSFFKGLLTMFSLFDLKPGLVILFVFKI